MLVRERTTLVNQIRGFLTEFSIVLLQGHSQIRAQLPTLLDEEITLPHLLRSVLADQYQRLCELDHVIEGYDHQIESLARTDERAKRLMKVEGIGRLTATALITTVRDIREFKNGRQFAGWLGLVPRGVFQLSCRLKIRFMLPGFRFISSIIDQSLDLPDQRLGFYCLAALLT